MTSPVLSEMYILLPPDPKVMPKPKEVCVDVEKLTLLYDAVDKSQAVVRAY